MVMPPPTEDEIRQRAYAIWRERQDQWEHRYGPWKIGQKRFSWHDKSGGVFEWPSALDDWNQALVELS